MFESWKNKDFNLNKHHKNNNIHINQIIYSLTDSQEEYMA